MNRLVSNDLEPSTLSKRKLSTKLPASCCNKILTSNSNYLDPVEDSFKKGGHAQNLGDQVMAAVVIGDALLHATANMAGYYLPQSRGSDYSGITPATEAELHGSSALPFDLSEFILSDEVPAVVAPTTYEQPPPAAMNLTAAAAQVGGGEQLGNMCSLPNSTDDNSSARIGALPGRRRDETTRIAFRMKSDTEILDDGFKWRKYGKKSVKNNSHPRNYYRCSTEGCSVKKRVERDRENPSYVITTYEGTHNHMSPGVVYYTTQDATTGQFYVAGCEMPPLPPGC